ncbi:substrate-binding periplasmic protein [Chitinimonas naiadis]
MSRTCLIMLLLVAALPTWAACSRVLRVPFEQWRPYAYRDVAGQPAGMEIELLQRIAQEAGCKLSFQYDIPRKRRLLMFQQGELDVLLAASDTPARRAYAWFSLPYREEEVVPFALPADSSVHGLVSLDMVLAARLALIVPSDGWYGARYAHLLDEFDRAGLLTRYESYEQAARQLGGGRGQLVIGDRYALLDAARLVGVGRLVQLPFHVNRDVVHLMLSKRSLQPGDLTAIDAAIRRLEQQGILRDIRMRYLDRLVAGGPVP